MSLKIILAFWFATSAVLIIRYATTLTPPRDTSVPIHAIVKLIGLPEEKYQKYYYDIQVTHLLTATTELKNIQHQTTLRLSTTSDSYRYGDILKVQGIISPYNAILAFKVEEISNQPHPLISSLYKLRQSLEGKVQQVLPPEDSAVALGATLGSELPVSQKLETSLKENSTFHMLVASGSNITILVAIVMSTAGYIHRRFSIILSVLAVLCFVTINGFQPPAIRGGYMASTALLAQLFGRYSSRSNIFAISIAIYWLTAPQIIHNISFQLSTLATAGIIYISPLIEKIFGKLGQGLIGKEISITIAAQLAVTPVLLLVFGQVSLIAPVANVAVAWSIPFIMLGTISIMITGYLSYPLQQISSFFTVVFTAYFTQTNILVSEGFKAIKAQAKINLNLFLIILGLLLVSIGLLHIHKKYSIKRNMNN